MPHSILSSTSSASFCGMPIAKLWALLTVLVVQLLLMFVDFNVRNVEVRQSSIVNSWPAAFCSWLFGALMAFGHSEHGMVHPMQLHSVLWPRIHSNVGHIWILRLDLCLLQSVLCPAHTYCSMHCIHYVTVHMQKWSILVLTGQYAYGPIDWSLPQYAHWPASTRIDWVITWGGGHAKQNTNVAFWRGKSGWNRLKFSWNNSDPKADIFQGDSSPRPSGAMSKHAKTLCPGREVARFSEAAKRERWGDNLTGKQNSLTTVGKSCAYDLASPPLFHLN